MLRQDYGITYHISRIYLIPVGPQHLIFRFLLQRRFYRPKTQPRRENRHFPPLIDNFEHKTTNKSLRNQDINAK